MWTDTKNGGGCKIYEFQGYLKSTELCFTYGIIEN
jgi:hypothetical protein